MIDREALKEAYRQDDDYQKDIDQIISSKEEKAEWYIQPENLVAFAEDLLGLELTDNQVMWHGHMVEHSRVLMEAAVGHGKSTWLFPEVVQWICRCQLLDEWRPILFVTSRADLAEDYTSRVKDALRSEQITKLYGVFYDRARRWRDNEFDVKNKPIAMKEPIWRAAGISTKIEGTRADWGILDDPVELDQALSPADRNRADMWFTTTFFQRMNPGSRITCIGSSWHPEDLYSRIRKTEGFTCFTYPCYGDYPWGRLLQPKGQISDERVGWTGEMLEEARGVVGETRFALRYMMDNTAMIGGFFDEGWIEYIDHIPEGIEPTQAWDFAIKREEIADPKKSGPDFTAGVTVGFDPRDGALVLLDIYHSRITKDHDVHVKNFWTKWNVNVVGVETNNFQKLIQYALQANSPEVPAVGVNHYEKKTTRLLALQPYFQRSWKIYSGIPKDALNALLAEYRAFPHGDHDDILDAMEICLSLMKKGGGVLLEGFDDW